MRRSYANQTVREHLEGFAERQAERTRNRNRREAIARTAEPGGTSGSADGRRREETARQIAAWLREHPVQPAELRPFERRRA